MNTPRWKPSVTVAAVIARDGRYLLVEEDTADGQTAAPDYHGRRIQRFAVRN